MLQTVYYKLSHFFWDAEGDCIVLDEDGAQLLILPIAFLRLGRVDQADFVFRQLNSAYQFSVDTRLIAPSGEAIHGDDKIVAGEYRVVPRGPFLPKRGPRFKRLNRPPDATSDYESTISNSKRSSANQSHFRTLLYGRDFSCVISDMKFAVCTAAHILPVSRPEYYKEIFGFHPGFLFDTSFGLLLRDDLHRAFDRGSIALWPEHDTYPTSLVIHIFNPEDDSWLPYHGKTVESTSRFRGPIADCPNIAMLRFHYQQCCIKHFRGYSSFEET